MSEPDPDQPINVPIPRREIVRAVVLLDNAMPMARMAGSAGDIDLILSLRERFVNAYNAATDSEGE